MIRNVTAVLLSATLALVSTAADLEIPRKLLDHELRVRAAFTPAQRAHVQALESRLSTKMSVAQVSALTQGGEMAEMFAVMMAYLKMVQKEAREDRKIARLAAERALLEKGAKLDQEKAKIEDMRREAGERFDQAMKAANAQMALGIVSNAAAAGAALRAPTPTRTVPRGIVAPRKTPLGGGVVVPK